MAYRQKVIDQQVRGMAVVTKLKTDVFFVFYSRVTR